MGSHKVKMDQLRTLFGQLGLENVHTFIQTGNVFFDSSKNDPAVLEKRIEEHLLAALGFEVKTFVRTAGEIESILKSTPFNGIELNSKTRHVIMFTSDPLPKNIKLPLFSPKGGYELIGYTKKEAFAVIHLVNGKYDSSNFIEKEFKVSTTSRFYHTTEKILAAAKATS